MLTFTNSNPRSTDEPKPRFFSYPARNREQREAWLSIVRRKNGSDWVPRTSDRICSNHFISGSYSTRRDQANYIPTLNVGPGPIPTFNFPVPDLTPDLDFSKGQ